MLSSLNSGVAGIRNFQAKLDVIGNDIANSNTIAYKSSRTNFADTFSQTLQGGSKSGGSLQVGSGVQVSSITNDFTAGVSQNTGKASNLYINGTDGFFIVKDSEGNQFATRAGDFVVDQQGFLATTQGYRVQGNSDAIDTTTGATFSTIGDIKVVDDPNHRPADLAGNTSKFDSFKIMADGKVRVTLGDSSAYYSGQVLLQQFTDVNLLEKKGDNLYTNLADAGPVGGTATPSVVPGEGGTGGLISGAVEMSNVDLASEFADLITTQRGFQANARIITTSDEVLQEVVNLKH